MPIAPGALGNQSYTDRATGQSHCGTCQTPLSQGLWYEANPDSTYYGSDVRGYYCYSCDRLVWYGYPGRPWPHTLDMTPTELVENAAPPPLLGVRAVRQRQGQELRGLGDDWMKVPPIVLDGPRVGRPVSCEQELSARTTHAIRMLEHARIGGERVNARGIVGSKRARHHPLVYMQGDGTCDGELVYDRLDLRPLKRGGDSRRYAQALEIVRATPGTAISHTCGHHVHVGAVDREGRRFTKQSLVNLYSIISHVEPMLYRLATAGQSRHRGISYCGPVPRFEDKKHRHTLSRVAMSWERGRYHSVNVQPFLQSLGHCTCGAARFGDWEDCTCDLPKHTIEFRLWNATMRADTAHAFIIVSTAIVDLAVNAPKPLRLKENRLMVSASGSGINPIAGRPTEKESDAWKWLVSALDLSDHERGQVLALANRTTLAGIVPDTIACADGWDEYRERVGTAT